MHAAQLAGSHASGTLQIDTRAINDVLALLAGTPSSAPSLELMPNNTVMVRYGVLHARAELPQRVRFEQSPRLSVRLASLLVAWAIKAAVRQPFVHIHGRQLTIDLAAVPALSGWRDLWKYLHQLSFETTPSALRVGFVVMVNE